MSAFPSTVPAPLIQGYGTLMENNIIRTPFVNGRARQRVLFTSVPAYVQLQWIFTDAEAVIFEAFADTVGADWFTINLKTPNGSSVQHNARFMETYEGPKLVSDERWQYRAKLELEARL